MAIDYIGIIGAWTIGKLAEPYAVHYFNTLWPSLKADEREVDYKGNWKLPNIRVDLNSALRAYYLGYLTYAELAAVGRINGVDIAGEVMIGQTPEIWQKVIDSQKPPWPLPLARRLFYRGEISETLYRDNLKRLGMWDRKSSKFLSETSDPIDVATSINLMNRGQITEEKVRDYLIDAGFIRKSEQDNLLALANVIPGPSDLIQFAVKDGWDRDVVTAFGYDQEFPPELQYWLKKQGLDWSEDVDDGKGGKIKGVNWPLLYWTQHWQNLAPGFAYQFQQRFRGDPTDPKTWRVPGVKPWTAADTARILKVNDYAPAFRDRLAALSYNVLGRIDVRRMYQTGIIDKKEMAEIYQDQGYTAKDATRQADYTEKAWRIAVSKTVTEETKSKIVQLYKIGVIDLEDMMRRLYEITIQDPLDKQAFEDLPIGEQTARAKLDFTVVHSAEMASLEKTMSEVKDSLNSIKRAFITGHTSEGDTRILLQELGVQEGAIARYIRTWQLQLFGRFQELSTANILKYYQRGIIPQYIAVLRLSNLGWRKEDIAYLFANLDYDRRQVEAKAKLAQAKTAEKQQSARAKLILAQQKAIEKEKEKLAREAKPAELAKWMLQGILTEGQYLNKMLAMGHTLEYAIDYLASLKLPPPAKPKAGATTNGQTKTSPPSP